MFTPNHFIWIAICAVMIASLTFCSIKFKWSMKTSLYVVSGISIASELCKVFTHIDINPTTGAGTIEPGALPLHLCSITIFVYFYLALTKPNKATQHLLDFVTPVSIVGGLLAIIMATSGVNFAEPYAYQCFIYHAGIVWFSLYCLITKQVKMTIKVYITNLVILFALSIIAIWVNGALSAYNTNFMYVVRPPAKGLPLLNLDNGWFAYYGVLLAAGFILLTLVSLPNYIIDKVNEKKNLSIAEGDGAIVE